MIEGISITDTGVNFGTTAWSGTSVVVSGLRALTTYEWKALASNMINSSPWSNAFTFTTGSAPPPASPILASPTNGSTLRSQALTLSWNSISTAKSYGILVSTNSTFSNVFYSQDGITSTNYSISNLAIPATYYWQSNASDGTLTSGWSVVWSFSTATTLIKNDNSHIEAKPSCKIQNGIIVYSIPKSEKVDISLYDLRGKQVLNSSGIVSAGSYRMFLNKNISAGCYSLRFKVSGFEKNFAAVFVQ
jgi:hypothetical protein